MEVIAGALKVLTYCPMYLWSLPAYIINWGLFLPITQIFSVPIIMVYGAKVTGRQ